MRRYLSLYAAGERFQIREDRRGPEADPHLLPDARPSESKNLCVNKVGMKLVGEMHFALAANYFFALRRTPGSLCKPMLELTRNRTGPTRSATATG